jgi:spore coat polysaccharide biosynthesis protein SpsF
MGHVVRCLALAEELRDRHDARVTFAMAEDEIGCAAVGEAGYAVERMGPTADEAAWLDGLMARLRPSCLVMDFRTDLDRRHVQHWRDGGVRIVTIDDPSDRRLASDLAFYPPVPQVKRMDWAGFTGRLCSGWEWVILRRQFASTRVHLPDHRSPTTDHRLPMILVTMGGSDPAGLTLKAVRALELLDEPLRVVVVIGAAFCFRTELLALVQQTQRPYEVRENVSDMEGLMAEADFAVASFCVTAYELAAMGIPGIYISLTEDHAESASAFVENGIGVSLGVHTDVGVERIAQSVRQLLADESGRRRMAEQALRCVDGHGAERIARTCLAHSSAPPATGARLVD